MKVTELAIPKTGRMRAIVSVVFTLVWALVMGILGKDDQIIRMLQGAQALRVPELVFGVVFWACALLLCSYLAGQREKLMELDLIQIVVLLVLSVILAFEPWGAINNWRDALLQGDISQMPLAMLASCLGALARPLLVVVALTVMLGVTGGKDAVWSERRRVSIGKALVIALACVGLWLLLRAVLTVSLGDYTSSAQSAAVAGLLSDDAATVVDNARYAVWYDMIAQAFNFAALLPALLVAPLHTPYAGDSAVRTDGHRGRSDRQQPRDTSRRPSRRR